MEQEKRNPGNRGEAEGIRLNKYLGDAGVCSRREADRLIETGRVTVDGVPGQTGMRVRPGQTVLVDGQPVVRERELILLAVNKPAGVVCTTEKKWGDQTLEELVSYPSRVFSIGRLDKDSEGLILMTNQGDIVNKILKAGNDHEKEYVVTVDRKVTPQFLKKMSKGVYLRELEVTTRPCRVEMAGERRFRIVLTQGLNRQIRRMCQAFGYRVTRLVRVRIMNVELGKLPAGQYRHLSRAETSKLMSGLKSSVNGFRETMGTKAHQPQAKRGDVPAQKRKGDGGQGNGKKQR